MKEKIYIFALAATGQGISGGDRIFIEFARRWSKTSEITIHVWKEGFQMCQSQELDVSSIKYQVSSMIFWRKLGFVVNYFARIVEGIQIGLTLKIENSKDTIVYSASEFWMDSFPCLILKLRYSKIRWVACWFQTAPNPVKGFVEGKSSGRYKLSALLYYLMQLPIKPLISAFADFVLINNKDEKKQFPRLNNLGKALVVLGAVDLETIKQFKKKYPKIYDAVFQGRFHPQKGVEELIDIWRMVVDKIPKAKLVMIGDGPLMESVKRKVQSAKLEKNVKLAGYLFDGPEKYKIFAQSKIVVHPAFYDSGGMATGEAMAFGLPAVGFDLKSFKSYYPKGMIKVKISDERLFAKTILNLLNNTRERVKLGAEALNLIKQNWSWDNRAEEVFLKIKKLP